MPFRTYSEVNKKLERWPSSIQISTNFSKKSEIFPITSHVKEMHERWNKLMVFVFSGVLCPEFSKAQPNVIGSSIVKSLKGTYHFLREVVPSESHNPTIVEIQDRSPLAVQGKITRGRGHWSDFGVRGRGVGRSVGRS